MQKEISAMKIDCVDIVNKIGSHNVVADAETLYKYLIKGDIMIKIECAFAVIDKVNPPASIDALIKETEEVYDFVTKDLK
jgi:hypothetical protein